MSETAARPTRAQILERVLTCIDAIGCRYVADPTEGTTLEGEYSMGGNAFLKLQELVEEEFEICIGTDELIDLAMGSPTIGKLLDLIEENIDA